MDIRRTTSRHWIENHVMSTNLILNADFDASEISWLLSLFSDINLNVLSFFQPSVLVHRLTCPGIVGLLCVVLDRCRIRITRNRTRLERISVVWFRLQTLCSPMAHEHLFSIESHRVFYALALLNRRQTSLAAAIPKSIYAISPSSLLPSSRPQQLEAARTTLT